MQYICPLLAVKDIQVSRDFYEGLLDQSVKYDLGQNITFEGDFAIHLKSHYQELIGDKEIIEGSNNFELYFELDEIEEMVGKLKENEVEFVHELREQPWRQLVARFYDPDKHIIEIGETMQHVCERLRKEGLSQEEVQEITTLPAEFVEFVFSMNEE